MKEQKFLMCADIRNYTESRFQLKERETTKTSKRKQMRKIQIPDKNH